jgi:hypothetical protein
MTAADKYAALWLLIAPFAVLTVYLLVKGV